ncbi:MAG: hypothetical protein NVS4B12_08760 [Ktedonobacteraceae bacterium]
MLEVLYSGQVEANDLNKLLAACLLLLVPQEALVLAEQLPTYAVSVRERQDMLLFSTYSPEIDVTAYGSGRVFQRSFELRWERRDDIFQVVYLGPGTEHMKSGLDEYKLRRSYEFSHLIEDKKLEYREKKMYLFGEQVEMSEQGEGTEIVHQKAFVEARIPRPLYYPVHNSHPHVQLVVREYVHCKTGQVEYFRFQALVSAKEH